MHAHHSTMDSVINKLYDILCEALNMSAETARAEFEYNSERKIVGYIMLRDFHDIGLTIETGEPDDVKLWRIHLRYDKYNNDSLTWIHKNVLGPHKRILCAVCHMDLYKAGDFLGKSAFCETCQSEVHVECEQKCRCDE